MIPGRSLRLHAPVLHGVEVGIFTAGSALGERLEQAEPEAERDTEVRAAVQEGVGEGQSAWSRGSNVQERIDASRTIVYLPQTPACLTDRFQKVTCSRKIGKNPVGVPILN